ncbi:E3 ubiquitin-protein ligase [Cricetulus griseus]|nr:E3 ubiquitin-protein ligase [Cricetulus griseus]
MVSELTLVGMLDSDSKQSLLQVYVCVHLCVQGESRILRVKVVSGIDLAKKDIFGASDLKRGQLASEVLCHQFLGAPLNFGPMAILCPYLCLTGDPAY